VRDCTKFQTYYTLQENIKAWSEKVRSPHIVHIEEHVDYSEEIDFVRP